MTPSIARADFTSFTVTVSTIRSASDATRWTIAIGVQFGATTLDEACRLIRPRLTGCDASS